METKKPKTILLSVFIFLHQNYFITSDNFNVFPHISAVILKITSPFLPSFAQRTSFPTLHPILVLEPLFKDTKPVPV